MHSRQMSVPAQPTYGEAAAAAPQPDQPQQQQSFWFRHPTFASVVYDVMVWERPLVTVGVYIGIMWLFFIVRAMFPDETSSTLLVTILAIISAVILLAGQGFIDTFSGTFVYGVLASMPELLIAPPRDEVAKAYRATQVENCVYQFSSQCGAVLAELGLAEQGQDITLNVLGKTVIGSVCVFLAFFLSLFSTRTLVILFTALVVFVPPSIHYHLVDRVLVSMNNTDPSKKPDSGATATVEEQQ